MYSSYLPTGGREKFFITAFHLKMNSWKAVTPKIFESYFVISIAFSRNWPIINFYQRCSLLCSMPWWGAILVKSLQKSKANHILRDVSSSLSALLSMCVMALGIPYCWFRFFRWYLGFDCIQKKFFQMLVMHIQWWKDVWKNIAVV